MDYVILEGNNRSTLEGVVCVALEEGWELAGGVAVVWDGREKTYCQATKRKI